MSFECRPEDYTTGLIVCRAKSGGEVAFNCPKPYRAYTTPDTSGVKNIIYYVGCGTIRQSGYVTTRDILDDMYATATSPLAMLMFGVAIGLVLTRIRARMSERR